MWDCAWTSLKQVSTSLLAIKGTIKHEECKWKCIESIYASEKFKVKFLFNKRNSSLSKFDIPKKVGELPDSPIDLYYKKNSGGLLGSSKLNNTSLQDAAL